MLPTGSVMCSASRSRIFFELGRNARVNSDSARHSGLYFY